MIIVGSLKSLIVANDAWYGDLKESSIRKAES